MRYDLIKQAFENAGNRYLKANPVGGFFKSHNNQAAAKSLIAIESYTPETIDWVDHVLLNRLQGEEQKCCELIIKFESIFQTMHNSNSLVKECYMALYAYGAEADLPERNFNNPQQTFSLTARQRVVDLSVDKKINPAKHLLQLKNLRREYFERLLNPSLPLNPAEPQHVDTAPQEPIVTTEVQPAVVVVPDAQASTVVDVHPEYSTQPATLRM